VLLLRLRLRVLLLRLRLRVLLLRRGHFWDTSYG
jgi:hypothetical protein